MPLSCRAASETHWVLPRSAPPPSQLARLLARQYPDSLLVCSDRSTQQDPYYLEQPPTLKAELRFANRVKVLLVLRAHALPTAGNRRMNCSVCTKVSPRQPDYLLHLRSPVLRDLPKSILSLQLDQLQSLVENKAGYSAAACAGKTNIPWRFRARKYGYASRPPNPSGARCPGARPLEQQLGPPPRLPRALRSIMSSKAGKKKKNKTSRWSNAMAPQPTPQPAGAAHRGSIVVQASSDDQARKIR